MTKKRWAELIAEARSALAEAERELAMAERDRPEPEARDPLAAIVAELAALDEAAVEQVRAEAEAAVNRYVIAAVGYNRVLDELRRELLTHGLAPADVAYQTESGQTGVRANGVVRLWASPREEVLAMARGALEAHAAAEAAGTEAPPAVDKDVAAKAASESVAEEGAAEAEPVREAPRPLETAIGHDTLAAVREEWLAPMLNHIALHAGEIEQLYGRLDQQQEHIDDLRAQLEEQSSRLTRVSAFLDALGHAQDRLR